MSHSSAAGPRRMSIVTRTVLLTSSIAALVVLVAMLVSYPLVHSAAETQTRQDLANLADLTATALDERSGQATQTGPGGRGGGLLPRGLLEALEARQISGYLVMPGNEPPPGVPPEVVDVMLAGQSVSAEGGPEGGTLLIEGRPLTAGGGVILVQPFTVVGLESSDAVKRIGIALLGGLLIAVPIGYWAARRLTRPLRAAADAANEMAAGSRDVTLRPEGPIEIADIAESLNRLNSALVVSEGRQREFLLSVSHELRTPLTAVKGYAEALSDGVIEGDDVPRTGATVAAEAARLDRLVTDLLDLARLGAVDFHVEPVTVDLVEVGSDAWEVWQTRGQAEDVTVLTELPDETMTIRTDPMRVRQIIDNLAENALRVSPPGSVMVLAIRPEPGGAVVEVRDSGPGLTDDDRSVAFEPGALHERYRGVRPVGTGLGLALVGRLARGLGGSAEVGQAQEGGARFTVHLPTDPAGLLDPSAPSA
ncbi:MAG: HAMP domain-containing protein [Actinomycetales bacterium]|nr:HAMP domain-containing protein [Actinomycetales bacterium]